MKTHNVNLIRGDFEKDKASKLLFGLLAHKIQYHQLVKFSSEERFGKDLDHSEKRISELKDEKQKLTEWIGLLKNTDEIEIIGDIYLRVKSAKE